VNFSVCRDLTRFFEVWRTHAGGNVTSAGWQVILCDPIWHVSSRSGEACGELLYPVTLLTLHTSRVCVCVCVPCRFSICTQHASHPAFVARAATEQAQHCFRRPQLPRLRRGIGRVIQIQQSATDQCRRAANLYMYCLPDQPSQRRIISLRLFLLGDVCLSCRLP